MEDRLRKLQFLDSLRGWAILLVLLVHAGGVVALFGTKLAVANFGQRGVQLFYEISAFSLLYSWYARQERSWVGFFVRRFFRIAPLFYLSIAANYIVTVWIARQPPLSPVAYASGFLFLFGFHPATINAVAPAGWSIAVEMTFYAFFPLLATRIKNLGAALTLAAVGAAACFVLCYEVHVYPFNVLPEEYIHFLWFPVEFPVFAFGFVAFFCWRDLVLADPVRLTAWPLLTHRWSRRAISLALLAIGAWIAIESFPTSNYRLYLNSLSFVFLILGLAIHPWRLLVNRVTGWIGRVSFSIYLIHSYLAGWVDATVDRLEKLGLAPLYGSYLGLAVAFALFLAGSLLLSLITYPLIEQKGIAAGKRLLARWSAPKRSTTVPTMDSKIEVARLHTRLRRCYAAWMASLLAVILLCSLYWRNNPNRIDRPIAEYRAEVARDQNQIDALSAAVLQNQRALKDAQAQLRQVNHDYKQAVETIKTLQARPSA